MFLVLVLNKKIAVEVMGLEQKISLCYANGMIGAMPVFSKKEDAEQFAGDKYQIAEITPGQET